MYDRAFALHLLFGVLGLASFNRLLLAGKASLA